MKAVLNKIRLDMTKNKIRTSVSICKGDTNSRQICITLINSGAVYEIPDNAVAVLLATKPDGKRVYNDCTVNGNEIVFDVTTQLIAYEGDVECQIELSDVNGTILTSPIFIIRVYEKTLDSTVLESLNEYKALTAFCTNAEAAATRAEENATQIDAQLKATGQLLTQKQACVEQLTAETQTYAENAEKNAQSATDMAGRSEKYATKAEEYAQRMELDAVLLDNYVAVAKESAQTATENKTSTDTNASNAALSEANAKQSETNAKQSETNAKQYETQSEKNLALCSDYADEASEYADRASNRENQACEWKDMAQEYAEEAGTCQKAAETAKTLAQTSEKNAQSYAQQALQTKNSALTEIENAKTDGIAVLEDKTAELLESLPQDYIQMSENVESHTAEIAEIKAQRTEDVDIYNTVLKDLDARMENKMNSIYTSNLGESHINDCQNGDIRNMKLYGATAQKRYSGTNLLEKMEAGSTTTVNGVTFTVRDDGGIMVSGTNETESDITVVLHDDAVNVLDRGNCFFSINGASESIYAQIYYIGNIQSDVTDKQLAFTSEEKTYTVVLKVKAGETVNNVVYATLTAEENGGVFEPYTGGEASPNACYPQELKAVEEINVRLCGKNLAGILSDKTMTTYGVATVRDAANQTITLNGTSTGDAGLSLLTDSCVYTGEKKGTLKAGTYCFQTDAKVSLHLYQADTTKAKSVSVSSKKTFTLEEDYDYCDMQIRWNTGTVFDNVAATVQLERGDTPTAYEPYTEQSFSVIPPKPLNAVGDCKDVCDVENGVWRYRTKTLSFDGSEAWKSETSGIGVRYYLVSDTVEAGISTDGKPAYSNLLELTKSTGTWTGKNCFSSHASKNMLYASLHGTETLEEFKQILAEKGFVITHQSDTEETTAISPDDMANLNALHTRYGSTHLFITDQNGNDITTWFDYHFNLKPYVEYVKGQLADGKELIYDMQAKQLDADVSNAWSLINAEYAAAVTDFS